MYDVRDEGAVVRGGILDEFIVVHKTHGVVLDECLTELVIVVLVDLGANETTLVGVCVTSEGTVDSLGLRDDLVYLFVDRRVPCIVTDGRRVGVIDEIFVPVVGFLLLVVNVARLVEPTVRTVIFVVNVDGSLVLSDHLGTFVVVRVGCLSVVCDALVDSCVETTDESIGFDGDFVVLLVEVISVVSDILVILVAGTDVVD